MKVSWLILTFNRAKTVAECFQHNFENAGFSDYEIIHVDNGSSEPMPNLMADIKVMNRINQGVARGYNQCLQLARGEYVVITGCDMKMPGGWMRTMVNYMDLIPNIGVISLYSVPVDRCPERIRGPRTVINGLDIQPAMPMGRRMMRRSLLNKVGYLREDFGMYGYEDCEHGYRLERYLTEMDMGFYVIPHLVAQHVSSENIEIPGSTLSYKDWKLQEARDPRKLKLMEWCKDNNYPKYFP